MTDWLTLLQKAVAATSMQVVADKLGLSRTAISLVMAGKYPAKTGKIAARVLDIYARHTCTHTGIEITQADCRATSASAVPTSSPQAMRHWRACQSCPHNNAQGGKP